MSKIYLVGGAVRDLLMGKEPSDLDYVVVGSSPEEMIKKGFEQVGADFPVFLHPETKDEYALARTERKVGSGYQGFETSFDSSITIEEDLIRRDLTINSIAMDTKTNELIDPYNGKLDIERKILRHTSEAFEEDPLRVLRVARFSARFEGFSIASDTMELMKKIYDKGEMSSLKKERIWKEFSRAIILPEGSKFFSTLQSVGVGKDIFPFLDGFYSDRGIPFTIARVHPYEMDQSLKNADIKERVARWSISNYNRTNPNVSNMWANLSAPKEIVDHVATSISMWDDMILKLPSVKNIAKGGTDFFEMIKKHDGFRRKERFLDAYATIKNHFSMLSGNPDCMPEPTVISVWIDKTTPTKEEISKTISGIDKKDIASEIEKLKIKKWKSFHSQRKENVKVAKPKPF